MAALQQLFGSDLLSNVEGATTSTDGLADNDLIGVYFSAHWCPPCRGFTPKLAETYNAIKKAGKKFEIIFVSFDRDEDGFKEYYETMPWLALPFESDKKEKLSEDYGVSGIPALIILNKDGTLNTKDGRNYIMTDPNGDKFPW